jgi:7-keto-8-aminopelargonate synthetase-like enzyme
MSATKILHALRRALVVGGKGHANMAVMRLSIHLPRSIVLAATTSVHVLASGVDDAHGTGVLGEHGDGIAEHFGIASERIIYMGTLSKAYGGISGFIATETHTAQIIRHSSGLLSLWIHVYIASAAALSEAVDMVRDEPERRARLWENQAYFVTGMFKQTALAPFSTPHGAALTIKVQPAIARRHRLQPSPSGPLHACSMR